VVAGVHGGEEFAAARAEEDEASVAEFRGRPVAAEGGDGGGHRQVVADSPQQLGGDHGCSQTVTLICHCYSGSIIGEVASFCQWGCMRTRLTMSMSTARWAERTASMRQPTLRLRALRRTPSAERTTRSMAGGVKVLWPSPAWSSSRRMNSRRASGASRLAIAE